MGEQSEQYFLRRERAERASAEFASSPTVRDIHLEMAQRYAAEAEQCRRDARRYDGKPEQRFLLHVASSFDELSARRTSPESDLSPAGSE